MRKFSRILAAVVFGSVGVIGWIVALAYMTVPNQETGVRHVTAAEAIFYMLLITIGAGFLLWMAYLISDFAGDK